MHNIVFKHVDWIESVNELKPVVIKHFNELPKQDTELDIGWHVYEEYARLGLICLILGYVDNEIKAYHISFVMPALHYMSSKFSISDSFWISPDQRGKGTAKAMFSFLDDVLKQQGVVKVLQNTRSEYNYPFEKIGYTLSGSTYSKVL